MNSMRVAAFTFYTFGGYTFEVRYTVDVFLSLIFLFLFSLSRINKIKQWYHEQNVKSSLNFFRPKIDVISYQL